MSLAWFQDEERLARRATAPERRAFLEARAAVRDQQRRGSGHPCRGKRDVSAATCWRFHGDWLACDRIAGKLQARGWTYGMAFLDLYLPDVEDEELEHAAPERAHEIVLARYVANG